MAGESNIFAEFKLISDVEKAVWIETGGNKIFEAGTYKIKKKEKIRFCLNGTKAKGYIKFGGKIVKEGKTNLSYEIFAKNDLLVTAEKKKYFSEFGMLVEEIHVEITER